MPNTNQPPTSSASSGGGGTNRPRPARPPGYPPNYPPPPPPMVFNPFWLCCLCCPDDLSDRISSCVSNTADSAFEGAAECVGQVIAFIFGPLMIFLGPLMVVLALGIIGLLSYAFFAIVLPMLAGSEGIFGFKGLMHIAIVAFILANVLFNYYKCLTVKNENQSAEYQEVVRELALATGVQYPESEKEMETFRLDFEKKIKERTNEKREREKESAQQTPGINVRKEDPQNIGLRKRSSGTTAIEEKKKQEASKASATSATRKPKKIPAWMLLGPEEWGFCNHSGLPKPPRSHYDSVTKSLVLNMDHYCPWTFNSVGYFNYRYFVTFVSHVFFGMIYSLYIAYVPFMNRNGELYERNIQLSRQAGHATTQHMIPFVPTPEERLTLAVAYVFVILTFLGVGYLFSFHLRLVLSAQTTIEERGNKSRQQAAESAGKKWRNPYSLGSKSNWQMVFGTHHPLLACMPSSRGPEFLPLPVNGKLVRRGKVKAVIMKESICCNVV